MSTSTWRRTLDGSAEKGQAPTPSVRRGGTGNLRTHGVNAARKQAAHDTGNRKDRPN